jgi:hypothetical protein
MTSNSRCENVICLLSKSWLESRECTVEFRTAEGFGKRILVARLENTGDSDITSHWQRCDLFAEGAETAIEVPEGPPVRFNTGAVDQLKKALGLPRHLVHHSMPGAAHLSPTNSQHVWPTNAADGLR